jgi:hypothetical protein
MPRGVLAKVSEMPATFLRGWVNKIFEGMGEKNTISFVVENLKRKSHAKKTGP